MSGGIVLGGGGGSVNVIVSPFDQVFTLILSGGGAEIGTGIAADLYVPFACAIAGWVAGADQAGDLQVDIWGDAYANFPPTGADSITGGNPIVLTGVDHATDTTLTGWTTAIAADTWLRFNVDAVTDITRATIALAVQRS